MEMNNQAVGPLQRVAQLPPPWQKLPNSKCKIPTEALLSLNTSERGCSSVRFSHNGFFLACAEVNKLQQNNLITIFEVNLIYFGGLKTFFDLDSTWPTCRCIYRTFTNDL